MFLLYIHRAFIYYFLDNRTINEFLSHHYVHSEHHETEKLQQYNTEYVHMFQS